MDNFLLSLVMDSLSTWTSEEPEQTWLQFLINFSDSVFMYFI